MDSVSPEIGAKIEKVGALIRGLNGAMVALSAGVDSSLVALLAYKALGENAIAVTGVSESLPREELNIAKQTADAIGIRHLTVRTSELENPDYSSNPADRCYVCKQTLYSELRTLADSYHFQSILDGTHVDDLGDDRPGLKAASEAGVISPLLQASFSKSEIRDAARFLGLAVWDKPAMPCLSSRIAHGDRITIEKLGMVGQAESYIKDLTGVRNLRVRYRDSSARIEVAPGERTEFFDEKIMDEIDRELRRLGFADVALDLRGYARRNKSPGRDELVLPMAV
ncbi:MAG TPA: ATP-dependent sacrificial sulfur transferase LarE [Candidatus Bathyarchaeia archaeon]|nr:ATP-dependent sacrificial sulfur transferase LarE [Candidatus Bathyarchaeia archaeon]